MAVRRQFRIAMETSRGKEQIDRPAAEIHGVADKPPSRREQGVGLLHGFHSGDSRRPRQWRQEAVAIDSKCRIVISCRVRASGLPTSYRGFRNRNQTELPLRPTGTAP